MTGRAALVLLALVHAGLGLWAIMGFAEFVLEAPPWPPVSNPDFPPAMLAAQWLLALGAALVFLVGAARRAPWTPGAMAVVYAALSAFCFFQHAGGFIDREGHWAEFVREIAIYAAILALLFRWRPLMRRLGRA